MNIKQTLENLRTFVKEEHEANFAKLYEVWEKPLSKKLETGETQIIQSVKTEGKRHLLVTLGENESRFREGDMICFHSGDAMNEALIRQATIEAEQEGEWLVRAEYDEQIIQTLAEPCYADADGMDLKPFFDKALDDVASSTNGRRIVLPLLTGELNTGFIHEPNYHDAADIAEENGLNERQVDAVAKGVAAQYLACIQGPPGTGKTKVIGLIAKLLVQDGHQVLLTSHTHLAINNALNKVAEEGVPAIKVGAKGTIKGLDDKIPRFDHGDDWEERPDSGYVIGATPFATCSSRLENFEFDTVIFDEASQITVPLAVMAMRKAKRFVFVGDHQQLPPVVLSKSVLDEQCYSVFSQLLQGNKNVSVMLNQTYRMNADLCRWPSQQYYNGQLTPAGDNIHRVLSLEKPLTQYQQVLAPNIPFVYIKSPGVNTRTQSEKEAQLVVDIIDAATEAGMKLSEIGVVTPYRNHGKTIKNLLSDRLGMFTKDQVVTDTVERMQGQEREMIIISLCSTDKQFIQAVAHFFFQPERLNVAVTRPKVKLILIGPDLPGDFNVDVRHTALQSHINAYRSLIHAAHTVNVEGG